MPVRRKAARTDRQRATDGVRRGGFRADPSTRRPAGTTGYAHIAAGFTALFAVPARRVSA